VTISGASSASSASPAAETGVRHATAILAIILVSYFMILLDNSVIFTALPKIPAAMRFCPAGLAWVQDVYTLVFGGLLLLGARAGDLLTLAGMAWLAQIQVTSSYWTSVAMPMVLIGMGQGLAFAPLTSAGIAGIGARDASAASGLVSTFHQLGMALGLSVLVAVSAGSGHGLTSAAAVLTAHVDTALTAATVLLAASLLAVLSLILPAHLRSRGPRPAAPQPEPGTMREPPPIMTSA
jgi:hypothetical protein